MFRFLRTIEIKRLVLLGIVFIFASVCLFGFILFYLYNSYTDIVNFTVSSIIENVHSSYPDIDDEELIRIINSNSFDSSILEMYGYNFSNTNFSYIANLENCMYFGVLICCCFLAVFGILCLIFLLFVKRKEYKCIDELYRYFNDLNSMCYDLKIADNAEDEFSKLRNELYKTTVLLKSTADASHIEKVNLSNALADISHQLKTPITSIRILLDNICNNPNMDETTRKEFLQEISKQIDWISSLIVSLLKLAKIDSGVIVMNDDVVDVNVLLDDVVSGLAILMDLKNVHVVKNIPPNVFVLADYKWIFEAFSNIVKNCVEHSYDDSIICIDVVDSSVFVKVSIRDFGTGICKEDLKHVFERFFKGKNSSSDSVGIGLSLAKSIFEQENAYVSVTSEVGKGSCFEVKFLKCLTSKN